MTFKLPPAPARFGPSRTFPVLFGIWTLVAAAILGVVLYFSTREEREIALNRAMDSYHKDLAYRRWASERGGVYVPLDGRTPPNPYLAHRPDRDLTTTTGKQLTLVNPAYMTRMVHELGQHEYGLQGHLTSLAPIRPENAPDAWEQKALKAFESGARDYSEVLDQAGQPVLRYMGAFKVEQSCLPCHAHQGYKVGDIRGGISVTVPVGSGIAAAGLTHKSISLLMVALFWVAGGGALFLWSRMLAASTEAQWRMDQELKESSERFRQLFESSPAPMFIHQGGQFTYANAAGAGLLEADTREDVVGRKVLDIVHPSFHAQVEARMRHTYERNLANPTLEEVFITLKGREVWVDVQSAPLDLPGGPAMLVFAQDLTERRHTEEERRKLEAEIQHAQKLDSLGSLAGGIAHDMNNVLGAIMGMASLLQAKFARDETLAKPLQTIENAAARGRDLVKGLTDFARKGLEKAQIMDLNALVRKELDLLERTSRQRFTFEPQLEEGLPPIMGEPGTLGSALMNLCVNAFDAMPRGGTLRIRTWHEEGFVNLMVEDTGEGIPPDLLARVTEPFFTTKPPGRGTGLGLAMVYGTVKAHGGTFDIQSEVGRGTRVRLRFPATEMETDRPRTEATPAAPERRLRILVVDDDELIRSILPVMLEQLGHHVDTASSGIEAIRRLDAGLEIDLVILDHNMPGLSGAETLPRILQLRPGVRILVSTGFLDNDLKLLLAEFPAVLAIQKPFSLAELRQLLRDGSGDGGAGLSGSSGCPPDS